MFEYSVQEPLVQWETLEYEYKEHSVDWYWGVALAALALAGISIVGNNPLFALFLAIATFTTFYFARRDPRMMTVSLYDDHIRLDNRIFPFDSFASFWVRSPLPKMSDETRKPTVLALKSKQLLYPLLTVPVSDDIDPKKLREFCLDILEEEEMPEHFSEQIMDRLGF